MGGNMIEKFSRTDNMVPGERMAFSMDRKTTTDDHCPFCGSAHLTTGTIGGSDNFAFFKPDNLKLVSLTLVPKSVHFDRNHAATVCRQCGHIWSEVDPKVVCQILDAWEKS
jgi:transcription elongation factor Elf1